MSSGSDAGQRFVFVSCTRLAREWRSIPAEALHGALFFFGSKRSWLFPSTDAERADAQRQPGDYQLIDAELLAVVAAKEQRGEVFFLKRPDLDYVRYPGPPDPDAYARASAWLAGLGYSPLRLDEQWWRGLEKRGASLARLRWARSPARIVDNFKAGYHEYDEVRELLFQSDRRLLPVYDWSTRPSF